MSLFYWGLALNKIKPVNADKRQFVASLLARNGNLMPVSPSELSCPKTAALLSGVYYLSLS